MEDIIDIIVTETTNLIEITSQPTDEIIDVNIIDNREDITLNVTPSVVEININSLTGNFGVNWGEIAGDLEDQTDLQAVLDAKADLVDGKVPSSQLPSYVDDIIEVATYSALPATGETGKIYVVLDTNLIYRWSGSAYIEIKDSSAVWGAITGTLSSQTDLQNALNAKDAVLTFSSPLSRSTNTVSIPAATSSANGYLTSTDWTTFNSKQAALSGTGFVKISGTTISYDNSTYLTTSAAASTYVPYTGATTNLDLGANNLTAKNLFFKTNGDTFKISNPVASGSFGLNIFIGNGGDNVTYTTGDSGSFNTSIGYISLNDITTGYRNTVIGQAAMSGLTSGYFNVAIGDNAGRNFGSSLITTANSSVFIGRLTKASANGNTNEIVIGFEAIGNGSNTVTIGNSSITANYFKGSINADSFKKSSGTSAQFLKADGSIDSSTYLTTGTASSTYLPLSGGTLTGALSGTSATLSSFIQASNFDSNGSQFFSYILKGRASDNFGAMGFYSNNGATRYGYIQSGSLYGGQINITGDGGGTIILDNRGITATGAATFSSTVATNGVVFPASQVASSDPNTLDDYEEGTFTPTIIFSTLGSPTYSFRTGFYTKVGRQVTVVMALSFNDNTGVGNVSIGGLPFTSISTNYCRATASLYSFGISGAIDGLQGLVPQNDTKVDLFYANGGASTAITNTNTSTDTDIYCSLTYFTT